MGPGSNQSTPVYLNFPGYSQPDPVRQYIKMLEKKPFTRYKLDDEVRPDIFTIRLNNWERSQLNKAKLILDQPKDSTALKTLADVGYIVLHNDLIRTILTRLMANKANNERSGAFVDTPSPDTIVIPKNDKK